MKIPPKYYDEIFEFAGHYMYLTKKTEGIDVAQWLNKNNITAFVLFYRVGIFGNRHPAMIQDLQRAMVKRHCGYNL